MIINPSDVVARPGLFTRAILSDAVMPRTNTATTRTALGGHRPAHPLLDDGALVFSTESGVSDRECQREKGR